MLQRMDKHKAKTNMVKVLLILMIMKQVVVRVKTLRDQKVQESSKKVVFSSRN